MSKVPHLIAGVDLVPCVQVEVKALVLHDRGNVLPSEDPESSIHRHSSLSSCWPIKETPKEVHSVRHENHMLALVQVLAVHHQ